MPYSKKLPKFARIMDLTMQLSRSKLEATQLLTIKKRRHQRKKDMVMDMVTMTVTAMVTTIEKERD
jgi:accessory gene regulator protein AgrB